MQGAIQGLEEVLHAEGSVRDFLSVGAGLADGLAASNAGSGQECVEVACPVIAARIVSSAVDLRSTTEFAEANDECRFQYASLLEVRQQN